MTPMEKQQWFFPLTIMGVLAGFLICLVLPLVGPWKLDSIEGGRLMVLAVLLVCFLSAWCLIRLSAIKQSKDRVNQRTGAAPRSSGNSPED